MSSNDPFADYPAAQQQPQKVDPNDPFANYPAPQTDMGVDDDPFANFPRAMDTPEPKIKEEVKQELSDFDSVAGARAFLEGMTFGFSDEVGTAISAGISAIGSDENFSELYDKYYDEYKERQRAFEEANPNAAMALEVGGAFLNPVNFVGKIKGAGQLITRAAAEGGVAGFGNAEGGVAERSQGALEGAAIGAAFGGGIALGGFMLKGAFGRKVAQDLEDAEGNFTPLTLAIKEEDGAVADMVRRMYRDVLSPSLGGSRLRKQEDLVVAAKEESIGVAKKNLGEIKSIAKKEISAIKNDLRSNLESASDELSLQKEFLDLDKVDAKLVTDSVYAKLSDRVKSNLSRASRKGGEIKEATEAGFRLEAFKNSLPAGTLKADAKYILGIDHPNSQLARVYDVWKSRGFKMLKGKEYKIDMESFTKDIGKRINEDRAIQLMAETNKGLQDSIDTSLGVIARDIVNGKIDGETLSAVRSSFGTASAKKVDPMESAVLSKVQDALDGIIFKQLTPKAKKDFIAEKAKWRTNIVLRQAVLDNSDKIGKHGAFTPQDWLTGIKKLDQYGVSTGKGALRNEAESFGKITKDLDESIKESAKKLADRLDDRKRRVLARETNKLKVKKGQLTRETTKLKRNLRGNAEKAQEFASNTKAIEELDGTINGLQSELAQINQLRSTARPTWFHIMAAQNSLGSGLGLMGNALKATGMVAASTLGIASGLVSKGAQKAVAGQTKAQEAAMRGVNAAESGMLNVSPILARAMVQSQETPPPR